MYHLLQLGKGDPKGGCGSVHSTWSDSYLEDNITHIVFMCRMANVNNILGKLLMSTWAIMFLCFYGVV